MRKSKKHSSSSKHSLLTSTLNNSLLASGSVKKQCEPVLVYPKSFIEAGLLSVAQDGKRRAATAFGGTLQVSARIELVQLVPFVCAV